MAYSVKADLVTRYGADAVLELTDDDANGVGDDALVTEAVADADAEIDAVLGARYAVPFTTVPQLIKRISAVIAAYVLAGRRRTRAAGAIAVDAQRAREWLQQLAAGEMTLGSTVAASADSQAWSTTDGEKPVFTRERLDESGAAVGFTSPSMDVW